jgi:hypothetical protein
MPASTTGALLWHWLDRAVATGLLLRDGTGRKSDPFRFWLQEKNEALNNDFKAQFERMVRENYERYKAQGSGEGAGGQGGREAPRAGCVTPLRRAVQYADRRLQYADRGP